MLGSRCVLLVGEQLVDVVAGEWACEQESLGVAEPELDERVALFGGFDAFDDGGQSQIRG